nr:uncharacterized protein LOC110362564 isoform X2 [Columba livia]
MACLFPRSLSPVLPSTERVVSDMAEGCESRAAHLATPRPDHQLVVRAGAAPGQPHQVCVPDTALARLSAAWRWLQFLQAAGSSGLHEFKCRTLRSTELLLRAAFGNREKKFHWEILCIGVWKDVSLHMKISRKARPVVATCNHAPFDLCTFLRSMFLSQKKRTELWAEINVHTKTLQRVPAFPSSVTSICKTLMLSATEQRDRRRDFVVLGGKVSCDLCTFLWTTGGTAQW